jgi:hypothetical protein
VSSRFTRFGRCRAGLPREPGEPDVRQQFAVLFRGRAVGGLPRGDQAETSEAAWIRVEDLPALPVEPAERSWLTPALVAGSPPHLA